MTVKLVPKEEAIVAYKAFDKNMQCRDFQYEVAKEYYVEGEIKLCDNGFHACIKPVDVLGYYSPGDGILYAQVLLWGQVDFGDNNSDKICASNIKVVKLIEVSDLVRESFRVVSNSCVLAEESHTTGYQAASSATGDQAASSATGDRAASSATGDQAASSATGNQAASSATGDRAASSATGYQAASSATGDQAASSATGYQAASSATGDRAASSATGDRAASSATGDRAVSSATGDRAASSATGDQAASSATGDQAASSATGKYSTSEVKLEEGKTSCNSVAIATNFGSKVRGPKGAGLVLVDRNSNGDIVSIWSAIVGKTKIGKSQRVKPDTWYMFEDGKVVEAE